MRSLMIIALMLTIVLGWADAPLVRPLAETVPEETVTLISYANAKGCEKTVPGKNVTAAYDKENGQLSIIFPGRQKNPSIVLWQSEAAKDCSAFTHITLQVTNTASSRATLWLTVDDADEATQGAKFGIPVDPGQESIILPINDIFCAKSGKKIDTAALNSISMVMEAKSEPVTVLVESVMAARIFQPIDGFRGFDFGSGKPFPGMIGIDVKTAYKPERGYGLTEAEGITVKNLVPEFNVSGGGLNGTTPLAVDLPNGSYEVQVIGYGIDWRGSRNHGFSINAEGALAADIIIDQNNYYTTEHFLFGLDRIFDPTKTVYDQYFKDYYAPQVFTVEVADGQLNLEFNNMLVCGMWLYPADKSDQGRQLVDVCRREESYFFAKRGMRIIFDTEPGAEAVIPDAAQSTGYALFARNFQYRVYPDYEPKADEYITALKTKAAPGEFEPAALSIRPVTELNNITITVSDLTDAAGNAIPAGAVAVNLVKQMPTPIKGVLYKPEPRLLIPAVPVNAPAYYNRTFQLVIEIPDDTAAGEYQGTVTVAAEGGQETVLPWSVTVYPFTLTPVSASMGVWDNNMGKHDLAFKWEGRDETYRLAVRNQIKDMLDHGLNGLTLPAPVVTDVQTDGTIKVSWSDLDIWAEEIMKTPMKNYEQVISVLGIINYRFMRRGLKEFSPEFNVALETLLKELVAWKTKHGLKVMLQVVDEPREYNINDWNRNRKDTIRYLKLMRSMVPELRLMVDPMADNDYLGDSYLPMIPLMDVCMTHSTPNSRQTIFLTRDEKLAEYIQYNNGMGRFTYGFFVWKDRSLGHWQWVYSWRLANQHVPFLCYFREDAVGAGPDFTILPTMRHEAVREGVDDLRYIRTLENELKRAADDNETAAQAQKFLKVLNMFLPQFPKHLKGQAGESAGTKYTEDKAKIWYGLWRQQIAEYIIALQNDAEAVTLEAAWEMFPEGMTKDSKTAECVFLTEGEAAPIIDGNFDDAAWKGVPVQGYFMNLARNQPADPMTEVKITTDGKKLYFAFTCFEDNIAQLSTEHMERDNGQWQDDSVEIFMDTNLDKATYKQIIINAKGIVQDIDKGEGGIGGVWDADIETAIQSQRGQYRVEAAITLESLGMEIKAGDTWGLNLCRNRKPALAETSSWTHVGHSFHNPSGFGTMVFTEKE